MFPDDDRRAARGVDAVLRFDRIEMFVSDQGRGIASAPEIHVVVVAALPHEVAVLDEDVGEARVDSLAYGEELRAADDRARLAREVRVVGEHGDRIPSIPAPESGRFRKVQPSMMIGVATATMASW